MFSKTLGLKIQDQVLVLITPWKGGREEFYHSISDLGTLSQSVFPVNQVRFVFKLELKKVSDERRGGGLATVGKNQGAQYLN